MGIYKQPTIYKQGLQFPTGNGAFVAKNGAWQNVEDAEIIEVKTGFENLITDNRNNVQFLILKNLPLVYLSYWLRVQNIPTYSNKNILSGNNLPIERIITGIWQNSWNCSIDGSTLNTGYLSLKSGCLYQLEKRLLMIR